MFRTVVFSSKPAMSRHSAPFFADKYDAATTLVVHSMLAGAAQFQYARGLPLSAYPQVSHPQYKLNPGHRWAGIPLDKLLALAQDSESQEGAAVDFRSDAIADDDVVAAIRNAVDFVYAGDPCASSVHAFWNTLRLIHGEPADSYTAYRLVDLSEAGLQEAFSTPRTTLDFSALDAYGEVKRYFEWNWNANALVVLRPVLRGMAGVPKEATVSKFGLQLLYFFRDAGPLSEGNVFYGMNNWRGTGKYPKTAIGSAASRGAILEQLQSAGLLSKQKTFEISDAGRLFLDTLHSGCKDLDLPTRLDVWGELGLGAAQAPIDRYIRTFFGRQLKFF